jgi:protein tyrosine phosphatase (PTP) superfamily phosphohydrolase (DUF442 family)
MISPNLARTAALEQKIDYDLKYSPTKMIRISLDDNDLFQKYLKKEYEKLGWIITYCKTENEMYAIYRFTEKCDD